MTRRTPAERLAIIEEVADLSPGSRLTRLANRGVSLRTVQRWARAYRERGLEGLADGRDGRPAGEVRRRLDDLDRRVSRLEEGS